MFDALWGDMPEFARRRRQGAVVSLMLLRVVLRLNSYYQPNRIVSSTLPEMLCVWVIRINDVRGNGKACSINRIAHVTKLPRASVKRYLRVLSAAGVVKRVDHGYVGSGEWLRSRNNSRAWERVLLDIKNAGRMLDKIGE